MSDKRWKAVERVIATAFGLKRRGADYGDRTGGKNDCVNLDGSECDWWSVEVKHRKRVSFAEMLEACRQAEQSATETQEPVAVIHRAGDRIGDSLVCMRLEVFEQWRLNPRDDALRVVGEDR